MKMLVLCLICGYRKVNDLLVMMGLPPTSCRFSPTCSYYAEEAVAKHGVVKGTLMGVKRIGRCHPFFVGGHDPVK